MKKLTLRTMQMNLLDCIHPLMDNSEEMKIFLANLVNTIDMNLIDVNMVGHDNPHAFRYNPVDKEKIEHGITGQAILVESHIAAHSWPDRTLLNVVITSCKDFDPEITALWISEYCDCVEFEYDSISF